MIKSLHWLVPTTHHLKSQDGVLNHFSQRTESSRSSHPSPQKLHWLLCRNVLSVSQWAFSKPIHGPYYLPHIYHSPVSTVSPSPGSGTLAHEPDHGADPRPRLHHPTRPLRRGSRRTSNLQEFKCSSAFSNIPTHMNPAYTFGLPIYKILITCTQCVNAGYTTGRWEDPPHPPNLRMQHKFPLFHQTIFAASHQQSIDPLESIGPVRTEDEIPYRRWGG